MSRSCFVFHLPSGVYLNAMFSRKLCYVYCPQELSMASLWGEHLQQEAHHFSGLGNWKEVFCMMSTSFHSKLPLNTGLCAPASFSPGSLSFLFFWWARICEWTACPCEQALQRLSKPFGLLVVAGLTHSVVLTPMLPFHLWQTSTVHCNDDLQTKEDCLEALSFIGFSFIKALHLLWVVSSLQLRTFGTLNLTWLKPKTCLLRELWCRKRKQRMLLLGLGFCKWVQLLGHKIRHIDVFAR